MAVKQLRNNQVKVGPGALQAARSSGKSAPSAVFKMPEFPWQLPNNAAGLGADSTLTAVNTWANSALTSAWNEGLTFPGYAYLAELAQRPEYRVMSETLAQEATREWIEFTGIDSDDDNLAEQQPIVINGELPSDRHERAKKQLSDQRAERIKALEAEFKRLNAQRVFAEALIQDGLFGRAHVYIDTGDTDNVNELELSIGDGWGPASRIKMAKRAIIALRVIEAVWCYPTTYNTNDPLKSTWYNPERWYVQSKIVHATRLLTIISRPVPDLLKATYAFGGLSLSQMAKAYVDNWLETRQAVNDIISAFSVFVLATNLGASLQGDGQELFNRAELFNLLRTNKGLMIVDKETELFQNVQASLSGLSELQAQAQEHMASVSHIPIVKLLGIQPAGLNASSEGELRSFYDWIGAYQEFALRPAITALLGHVMLSLWGEIDHSITFKFRPLWSLDEKQEAEVQKIKAETDAVLIDSGIIDVSEARHRIADDSNSGYDTIDADISPEREEGLGDVLGGLFDATANDDQKQLAAE